MPREGDNWERAMWCQGRVITEREQCDLNVKAITLCVCITFYVYLYNHIIRYYIAWPTLCGDICAWRLGYGWDMVNLGRQMKNHPAIIHYYKLVILNHKYWPNAILLKLKICDIHTYFKNWLLIENWEILDLYNTFVCLIIICKFNY